MKAKNFIDESIIKIKSGNGGNGVSAFHREKYVERGGPSGGNGGNGGSVYFIADRNKNNLLDFINKKIYYANNGKNGGKQKMNGANGTSLYIHVPLGTEIYIDDKKKIDLIFDKQTYLAQKGGKGGRGNASFKSSKNNAPTLYELGEKTFVKTVNLNLKVLADVGIVGLPNIGKSTFVKTVSNAKPEVANYEFTTINPHLGAVEFNGKKFIITDLPGIIKDAHKNAGMGLVFLKHLERTKIILHFIDPTELRVKENYKIIRSEINHFSKKLANLPEIIIITKSDLVDKEIQKWIKKELKKEKVFFISSLQNEGIDILLEFIIDELDKINQLLDDENKDEIEPITISLKEQEKEIIIEKIDNNHFLISGTYPIYWANRIPLTTTENFNRLWQKLKSKNIIDKLVNLGLKDGDFIEIKDSDFFLQYES